MTKIKILQDIFKILVQDFINGIIDNDTFFSIGEDLYFVKMKHKKKSRSIFLESG